MEPGEKTEDPEQFSYTLYTDTVCWDTHVWTQFNVSLQQKSVKQMKTNAAAVWIVNRVCQQMIEIHQHGQDHEEKRFLPFVTV